jgi:hypothetical protein
MKTVGICLILIVGGLGFAWARHRELAELRCQNAELRRRATEVSECERVINSANQATVDTNELGRLHEEHAEIMRLRSELGQLRQVARLNLPTLQQQADKTVAQAAQEQERGPALLEDRAAKLHSALARDFLRYSLLSSLRELAQANAGRFPASFSEMERILAALPQDGPWRWTREALRQTDHPNSSEEELIGRQRSVSAQDFEFIPSPQPLTIEGPSAAVVREAKPRTLADGRNARWYGFTDGRVEEVVTTDATAR